MKVTNRLSKLLMIFGFIALFASTGWADTGNNGQCNKAQSVTLPYSTSLGSLGSSDRDDYYAFDVPSAGTVTITTSGSSLDIDGYLYNSNCNALLIQDTSYSKNVSISYHVNSTQTLKFRLNYSSHYYPHSGHSTNYSLSITFTPDPAHATDDTYVIPKNTSANGNLLSNDSGDNITLKSHTNPAHGTLSGITSNGNFTYTPDTDYVGTDSFDYTIEDSNNNTATATVSITVTPPVTQTTGGRDFTQRATFNLFGNVKVIGNTILCKFNKYGKCVEPNNEDSNAQTDLQKTPISSSTLTLPTGAIVKYARLYWQGRAPATTHNNGWSASQITQAKTIELRKGTSGLYTSFTADIIDLDSTEAGNWVPIYSANVDVSSVVNGSGIYEVNPSTFYTETGETWDEKPYDGLGAYGAWVLVVVYEDPNELNARNVTIFDGFKQVTEDSGNINVPVSGFLTPKSGAVDSDAYIFAGEGDKYITGDHLKMAGATYNTTLVDLYGNNAFNSRIDVPATRDPDLNNNNGIDIQKYNVGSGGKEIITNNETGAKFQFTSTGDTYFPSLIVFSTQLYLPKLCYDYSYKQHGVYFSQDSNLSAPPSIDGTVSIGDPITVGMYLKNLVPSDVNVTDMKLSVLDINTTQVQYINGTTYLAPPGSSYKIDVSGSPTVQSLGSVTNIPVGTISSEGYLYLYYDLDPQRSILNTPINVVADYNIQVGSTIVPYSFKLGSIHVPLCPPDSTYAPPPGIFNVVNSNYKTNTNSLGYYNNLPTEVVARPEDFKILSLSSTNYNQLQDTNRTVFTDMIDTTAYHDINASCDQLESSISSLKEVRFDNNQSVSFNADSSWFSLARRNAAFRISYNVAADGSDFNTTQGTDGTVITNFPDFTGQSCSAAFYQPGTSVASVCGTGAGPSGNGMNATQYKACMECIYGYYTKFICSRDNFAIRPAAFNITFKDQSQINPTNKSGSLTASFTGVTSPITGVLDLAAGYRYDLNVTAVNAQNNNPSPGYYTSLDNVQGDDASYLWSPLASQTTTGCNDDDNKTFSLPFMNGEADTNTSIDQVGRYTMHIVDTTWTAVDHDPADMTHHTGTYFLPSNTPDCTQNSSTVQAIGSTSLNGCDISSDANNSISNLKYRDINVMFHPYWFDMTGITPSIGINHDTTVFGTKGSFVYMSDVTNPDDENMSFHLNGPIKALGENNATLSNFVSQCYAVPVELNVSKTAITTPPAFQYSFHDFNSTDDNISTISGDMNSSDGTFIVNDRNFTKDNNGALHTTLNLNFARDQRVPTNPQQIKFLNYQAKCQTPADCTFQADLNSSKKTSGFLDLNQSTTQHISVNFYYGRTHAPRYKFQGDTGVAKVYYEVYCNKDGNTTILPNGADTNVSVDGINWYNNEYNTPIKDGDIGTVSEQRMAPNVATSTPTTASPSQTTLQYNQNSGYPYQTTMENNASGWLIYNPYNAATKVNTFDVEFYKADTNWTGVQGTHTSTDANASSITNQRIMW